MKRIRLLDVVVLTSLTAALNVGCGDNSKECGPGTADSDSNGICEPTGEGGNVTCTDGTVLNSSGDGCVIDPNACQDGTVLVDGACVDPGHVTVNLEEAAEPNGLGLLDEDSQMAAGIISLTPGSPFVLHGTIKPHADHDGDGTLDADVDTFLIDVSAPTLLDVTSDGLHGLAATFISVAAVDQAHALADWQRFGIAATSDTAKRQLWLPEAGTYIIAIVDTRTLFASDVAVGGAEGESYEYYVTLKDLPIAPEVLTPADGVAMASGDLAAGEVKLFQVPMGEGINSVASTHPTYGQYFGSTVISNSTAAVTRAVIDSNAAGAANAELVLGFKASDNGIIAIDNVYDYALATARPFTLTVTTRGASGLSRSGEDVMATTTPFDLSFARGPDDAQHAVFYYDVGAADEILGMNLQWSEPVSGVLLDEDGFIFSYFSFDPSFGFFFDDTFEGYQGLLRHFSPGRYYFLIYVPDEDAPVTITATSKLGIVTAVAVAPGTPSAPQTVDPDYDTNVLSFAPGTSAWNQFLVTGTGTGDVEALFFNPGTTYGRLDPVPSASFPPPNDVAPLFFRVFTGATAPLGRITLQDNLSNYLVLVNTQNGDGTFIADFQPRPHHDYGMVAAGSAPIVRDDEAIEPGETKRYLVRTDRDNDINVLVHDDALVSTLSVQRVNASEANVGAAATSLTQDIVASYYQATPGFTAFVVRNTGVTATTFDITLTVTTEYTLAAGTTAYADACAGGTPVAFRAVSSDPSDDEGVSNPINLPADFRYFGAAATSIQVSTNGFVTVGGPNLTTASFSNANMPSTSTPNGVVAPQWDDLAFVQACTKEVDGKLVVQWNGELFSFFGGAPKVQFQAIFDPANDSIEFVYGAANETTGTGATVGIENLTGTKARVVGFNQAVITAPGSLRFTPSP